MAMQSEVADLLQESKNVGSSRTAEVEAVFSLAEQEVQRILHLTKSSLLALCQEIESASTRKTMKAAVLRFRSIMRIFLELTPAEKYNDLMLKAIRTLGVSKLLENCLTNALTVSIGIDDYLITVIKNLGTLIRREQTRRELDISKVDELFSLHLPEPSPPADNPQALGAAGSSHDLAAGAKAEASRKRKLATSSPTELLTRIPKKSKSNIPALSAFGSDGQTTKKHVLKTRQILRAGLNDPRGLLNLVDSSTNALERTKKLELLKSAGLLQNNKRSPSFADKLNDAVVNLGLGLGGQSSQDTLLFGAKVLSSPGFLTKKNISDINNNVVVGNTAWRHQDAYARMMIAGCLNQAKLIVEKFDEILHGSEPEILVQKTHESIKGLLLSEECRGFLRDVNCTEESSVATCDKFIKRIVQAVHPIVPITMRNKVLDAGYLRTALHLLGATELLYTRYWNDVRIQANPAGVVGMAAAMHADIADSLTYDREQKSLSDFMQDVKAQYLTSFGLGTPFARDDGGRPRRRNRSRRGRSHFRGYRSYNQGVSRADTNQQTPYENTRLENGSPGQNQGQGRGVCYAYQAGTCRRGGSCKYSHPN